MSHESSSEHEPTTTGEPQRARYVDTSFDDADFRNTDLRGLDFSNASMRGADFRGAQTGRSLAGNAIVTLIALVASVVLGVLAGIGGKQITGMIASGNRFAQFLGIIIAGEILVLLVSAVWKGLDYCVRHTLPPLLALAVFSGAMSIWFGIGKGSGALIMIAFACLMLAFLCLGALARAFAGSGNALMFLVVAISGMIATRAVGGGLAAVLVALASMIIGRQALSQKISIPLLSKLTLHLAHLGGTKFVGTDLTNAKFGDATIRSTDFHGAHLDGSDLFTNAKVIRLSSFDDGLHEKKAPKRGGHMRHRHAHGTAG